MNRITEEDARRDYYKLLGVDPAAHPAIIKSAYRTNMLELAAHPDRGGTTETAMLLNRAREVLLDPTLRQQYDRTRTTKLDPPPPSTAAEPSVPTRPSQPESRESVGGSQEEIARGARLHRWLVLLLASMVVFAAIIIWRLGAGPTGKSTDIDVWTFPAPSLRTLTRGENIMYDLGDGFYGRRVFRQGQWIARIDIPERIQNDMHTAVKLAILKSLRVANTAQYDRSDVCRLVIQLTGPSGVVGCPVRNGITAEAQLVWKTDDGHTAVVLVLRYPE